MKRIRVYFLVLISAFALVSCQTAVMTKVSTEPAETDDALILTESDVKEIPLIGAIVEPKAEISGMAWCGTKLILLPQYPDRFSVDGVDHFFSIEESTLDAFSQDVSPEGIEPEWITFESNGIESLIDGFEGFESIVFNGDEFYVSIEAHQSGGIVNWGGMVSYFVKGQVKGDCSSLILDTGSMQSLETPIEISNLSYETMLIFQDKLYAIYEANGADVNPDPAVHVFDLDLNSHSEIRMENIEYRITDATEPDEDGYFWAMNYFFPGDTELETTLDPIAMQYGLGESHQDNETVERLLRFVIDDDGIRLADEPPIYLELLEDDSRNWEGLVQYREGFLLATDKFPTTILGYVKAP